MRKLLATSALALCLGATAGHAAGMKDIAVSGYWAAQAGINVGGYPMCEAATRGHGFDGSPMWFMIKYDSEYPGQFSYQFVKGSWNLPAHQPVRVALKVDNAPGRIFTWTQFAHNNMVDFEIQLGATDPTTGESEITYLANLLRSGKMLRISFPDGSEADWGAPLEGANVALNAMSSCIGYLANNQQASQPYAPGAQRQQLPPTSPATQPYGGQQQLATQPYGRGE